MKLYRVLPDHCDWDMYCEGLIVADTEEEAVSIATESFNKDEAATWVKDTKQVWTAELIDLDTVEKGVLLDSFKAG